MCIRDNSVPVVVLVSSQHGGLGIIRSLGREGVAVSGVHEDPREPAARSRYLQGAFVWDFSASSAPESVSFLQDVARRIGGRPILLPTSDITALFVAENAEQLCRGYLLSTPSAEVVRKLSSKKLMFDLCRKLAIPTVETVLARTREDVLSFAGTKRLPIIVKSEHGEFLHTNGTRARVAILSSEKELVRTFDLNSQGGCAHLLLQEYIPGDDDTIWMFNGYFNNRSECLFGATGRKLRQFPPHRGSTSLGICARNDVVEAQTLQLTRAVSYTGPLDIGYRFDARVGQYKLLDVNPRIGATFRLFVAENGVDVAHALYLDLTGHTVPKSQARDGRKWIVESNDLISTWAYFRENELSIVEWVRSLRGIREGVWLAQDDLSPAAGLPSLWFRKRLQKAKAPKKNRPIPLIEDSKA
jgi:D-aspartate ligase